MKYKISFFAYLLCAPLAQAELNDSGQGLCYDGTDYQACSGGISADDADYPRQDGRFGFDVLGRGFDFQTTDENGRASNNGRPSCVLDRRSGLLWEVVPENTTREPVGWTELPSLVEGFNLKEYCGRQDWRVPTHSELQGIVNYGRIAPAVDKAFFPDAEIGGYWSSDSFVLKPEQAWALFSVDGNSKPALKSSKQKYRFVAQVQTQVELRFQEQPDNTVLDERTGLIWDRCSLGQVGKDCEQGKPEKFTWQNALKVSAKANQERYKGYDDWRVPNVKELLSIVDIASHCPSVDASVFPKTACYWYWSSTPRATDPGVVWDIGFDDGHIGFGLEDLQGHVRLVRNGTNLDGLKQSEKLD